MKNQIHANDFTLEKLDDNNYQYFSYYANGYEFTIEPRIPGGFDVAHYDESGILCGKKIHVKEQYGKLPHETFMQAVRVANAMYGGIKVQVHA